MRPVPPAPRRRLARSWVAVLVGGLLVGAPTAIRAAEADHPNLRHSLRVELAPATGRLVVRDVVTVPPGASELRFVLNGALRISASDLAVEEIPLGDAPDAFGINSAGEMPVEGGLKRYRVPVPPGGGPIPIEYSGLFDFGLSDQKEEYTRGFRETAGIVSERGVYLAGSGFWYPRADDGLVEFELEAAVPPGWHLVAPGNGTSRADDGIARWDSAGPVDEITLVGGPLHVYRDAAGAVTTLVYLHERDDALAAKYLEATAQYLEMYRSLLGPYPYGKFALVENFWETGYGMPSFTLLGPQIIRFPFILTSSYPHEILHNWWGNSVFVDYKTGNWCEGLTAYMADYLIREQRGQGAEYRRDTLQRYASYVRDGRDFPLSEFRSRYSAATEAVGYGRTLMGFHMLRRRFGDEAFRNWAARFYREERGRRASFADVQKSFEQVAGESLERFFIDWVKRAGAPELAVAEVGVARLPEGGWQIEGRISQAQGAAPFALDVPVVAETEDGPVAATVPMTEEDAPFTLRTDSRPLALYVDPEFDVFRKLDPRETPPSIGQIFGAPRSLAVIPAGSTPEVAAAYRALVDGWRSESHEPEIRTDAEVRTVPDDRPVWVLGRDNALAKSLFGPGPDYTMDDASLHVGRESMPLAGHTVVILRRHPGNREAAIGWIFTDTEAALPGLGRKLPHYGRYSYLGFEGDEPTNVLKGQWAATDSPLRVDLRPDGERGQPLAPPALAPRAALAELPPVFSQKALMQHVQWLADPAREGRGIGTKGMDDAADYVAARFRELGLAPGGDAATFFQSFETTRTPSGKPATLRNVVAVLPGTRADWAGQSVLLTAHYDHLGRGFPDVHARDEGAVHPGADDNASGVAVMLELAKSLVAGGAPRRSVVFIAFSGEEEGRLGSIHYAERPPLPLARVMGVINLDTVGRLGTGPVSVIGSGTASEWVHIFRGASYVTGVESRMLPGALESSDQLSFIERGVPAVQVLTDTHADYHRPGDTADKVDGPGLVRVATFVKEGVAYLAEREEPLTNTIASAAPRSPSVPGAAPASGGSGRRVSFGTVPDFAFAGPGVRVSGVVAGSPAEKAGVKEGDILLRFAGQEIADLRAYSDVLRGLEPGQSVSVVVRRDGEERTLEATLAAR